MRRSSEGSLGQDLVPTAANWSNWVRSLVTTHFCLVSGLFWTPRDPKSTRLGHKCPFLNHMGPNKGPNSKLGECFFFHWLGALLLQVDHTIGLQHFEFWPHIGPFGAKKGHFVPKRAFFGPLGVQKGAQYQPKICGNHDSNPVGPIGGSWDQIWPPGAL